MGTMMVILNCLICSSSPVIAAYWNHSWWRVYKMVEAKSSEKTSPTHFLSDPCWSRRHGVEDAFVCGFVVQDFVWGRCRGWHTDGILKICWVADRRFSSLFASPQALLLWWEIVRYWYGHRGRNGPDTLRHQVYHYLDKIIFRDI